MGIVVFRPQTISDEGWLEAAGGAGTAPALAQLWDWAMCLSSSSLLNERDARAPCTLLQVGHCKDLFRVDYDRKAPFVLSCGQPARLCWLSLTDDPQLPPALACWGSRGEALAWAPTPCAQSSLSHSASCPRQHGTKCPVHQCACFSVSWH